MTFEEYLRKTYDDIKWIDHSIRCNVTAEEVTFYTHPAGKDGETVDFLVEGNQLTTINNKPQEES